MCVLILMTSHWRLKFDSKPPVHVYVLILMTSHCYSKLTSKPLESPPVYVLIYAY